MNTQQSVNIDERTMAISNAAHTWGLNFLLFALLLDVMFRGLVFGEAAWDLLGLVIISGAISSAYMARHKVLGQLFGWKMVVLLTVVAIVSAVAAAIIAMIQGQ
jgi:hypothetical protein